MDVNLRVILASCEPRIQEPAVPNASLIKSLSSSSSPLPGYNNEVATSSKVQPKNNKECEICSTNPSNTIVLPCRHSFSCHECIDRVKKCLICKEVVKDKLIIPDLCFICEESTPTIQFNPCGHLICCSSCSKLTKKCPKCRQPIKSKDNMKSIGDLRASSLRQSKKTNSDPKIAKNLNNNRSKNQDTALKSLQAKYDELRNRVICAICIDNIINMVFLCGHGACQPCGDKCTHCPICRKRIENKILLYCQ